MLHDNVKTLDVTFKKMGENKRTVELALEGQIMLISGQKYNFKAKLTKGERQLSKLLTAPLLLAAVSIFSKHKRRVRKQTVFFLFFLSHLL